MTEDKLASVIKELALQNEEKQKLAKELVLTNKNIINELVQKFAFQKEEKEKLAKEFANANQNIINELVQKFSFQNEEKEKLAIEFAIANEKIINELVQKFAFQTEEKEKLAKELALSNEKIINELEQLLQNNFKEISDYKYALDQSSILAITDQKGIIKKVNNNFCVISKYSEAELIGQDHRIINSGYHPKEFIRDLWTTIANGKIWRGELKNKSKDGTFYWVDTTIVPFLNNQGKSYQYVAIRSDITERKKLEEQQVLFASIVNSSDDAILSITLDGIVTTWNHSAEEIFGYDAKEIIGKHLSVLIPPHLEGEENVMIEKIRSGEFVNHYETERKRKDGKIIYVSISISPVKDALGNIIGASKISRDITSRKETEDYLIQRTSQLETSNKELESFNYISSHDLQEPLRKIQTFVTRIMLEESKNLSDQGKKHFLRIEDAASRMQTLIADLLSYSRITTSERKFETTDLNAIIEEVKNDFKETIEEMNATIEVTEIGNAHIIPFQFRQLIHNLIANALKFSNPDIPPHIIIKSRNIEYSKVNANKLLPEKDYCHITISDNGIGFEPQYKDRIFEMFQRLHDKEIIRGTGIGLTIVKKIVDNHNGVITATGELNKGATFDIYIPSA